MKYIIGKSIKHRDAKVRRRRGQQMRFKFAEVISIKALKEARDRKK